MYLNIRSAAATAAAALCVAIRLLLLPQQLLLFVIVCRRTINNVAGSLNLIPSSVFSLFNHTRFSFCMHSLAILSHLRPRLPILHRRQIRACAEPRQTSARDDRFCRRAVPFLPPWAAFVGRALAQCSSLLHSVCSRRNTANAGAYLVFVMLWCCEYCEANSA